MAVGKIDEVVKEDPWNEVLSQMEQMSHRMHSAIATSEELRRRLAMLNRYYQDVIRKFQQQLDEAKADREQVEFDLSRQISILDRERREALGKLESFVPKMKKGGRKKVEKVLV